MTTLTKPSVREAAENLVRANIKNEPAITKAYLFPSDEEIRLIYVDPTAIPLRPDEQIEPFYFGASRTGNSLSAAYTIAVALILPEEVEKTLLPDNWGKWDDAEILWEKI